MRIMQVCKEKGVWLENCEGVNVTVKGLLRAGRDPEVPGEAVGEGLGG